MTQPPSIRPQDADAAYNSAQRVVEVHRRLAAWLREGQTTAQIDQFVASALADLKCRSCFLGYRVPRSPAFPSHACLSVNNCIVHGTAGSYTERLRPGDLIKIDIGVVYQGWIGDAAWTYAIKEPSDVAARLMDCGKRSLAIGIQTLRPENTYMAWARAVQGYVEGPGEDGRGGCGFHLVRGLGGHGYGRRLHEPPYISNVVPTFSVEWPDAKLRCDPGTLVAVEPMIAVGTGEVTQKGREWPIYTADGSLSVHYEHDVLITEGDPRVLTEGLDDLPDVVG